MSINLVRRFRAGVRVRSGALLVSVGLLAASPAAWAVCGNGTVESDEDCDDGGQNGSLNSCCTTECRFSGEEPDVIVGELVGTQRYGTLNGITAYAIGTTSCNVGSCWLKWISSTPEHPVIGQNMFRLKNGRFEHIGQSWLKHGFTALAGSVCGSCNSPGTGARLGVNCSDPYSASLNGGQSRLGPKVDVNPSSGVYPYPDARIGTTGDAIFKRLQVHNTDLDPAQNVGAQYFIEGQYVTLDDAGAGNNANNASYRPITVGAAPNYDIAFTGTTQREKPGILAWGASDPSVTTVSTAIPGDGVYLLAAKATPLGNGVYHYEYALQNLTGHRAVGSFRVPIPAGTVVTNVGFHDVDYHSGEPFSGTDWPGTVSAGEVTWQTQTYAVDPNANALRWGTLYNFRFDANVAPGTSGIAVGLFRPGSPDSVSFTNVAPGSCTFSEGVCGNGADDDCDGQIDCADLDCCTSGACAVNDGDGDLYGAACDCDDARPTVYPGAPQLCDGLNNDCSAPGWPAAPANEADADGDGARICGGDCDDTNPERRSGLPESCDGIDNDCAGGVPAVEADADADGVRICGGDCDDANPQTYPGHSEVCDGRDNDCESGVPPIEADADGDGVRVCAGDCDDANPARHPAHLEICDGFDNDCAGGIPAEEADADADGVRVCGGDCDDADPERYPGRPEQCDGLDSNCNPFDSELDSDGDGFRVCAADCADDDPQTFPGAPELCDGIDNDCDGSVAAAEADADEDGVRICAGDCDDTLRLRAPGLQEICDGIDNDCDNVLPPDEVDGDQDGALDCQSDCNAADPSVWATPGEVRDLAMAQVDGVTTITWTPPLSTGCTSPYYDTLRSPLAGDFVAAAACIEWNGADTSSVDADPAEGVYFYLVRCKNDCPVGEGSLGNASGALPRAGRLCP